jgi:hypothetical protein
MASSFFVFYIFHLGPSCASPNRLDFHPQDAKDQLDLRAVANAKELKATILQYNRKFEKGGKPSASCAGLFRNLLQLCLLSSWFAHTRIACHETSLTAFLHAQNSHYGGVPQQTNVRVFSLHR